MTSSEGARLPKRFGKVWLTSTSVGCLFFRTQLGECLKSIVHADYPERWPQLLPLLDNNMKAGSAHPQRLYGALYTLRILTRKYE